MSVKEALKAKMEQHIQEMVATNPMIGQLNTQFTSWLLGSGLTGTEIINMIDTNMDATIQPVELATALQETTGTQPPGWVINGLMSVLDMDKDGNVTVADLHTYFEAIGLPSGIEEMPEPQPAPEPEQDEFEELNQEIEEEAKRQAEELIRQQEAEKQRLLEEQAREAAEREAEEQAKREEEAAKAKPQPIILEEDGTTVDHARFIEILEGMKLSSERRELIAQSPMQSCQIQISSIEKTLVGQGPLKNGMTIIGTLFDNSDIEVELRLPAEANEQAMMFQSKHSIEADAQICDWNVGRKRAIFAASDFQYL